ncbi:hypothetical protein [Solimonas sp. K1W22B-7]|uniref:hypothetical protein n=1 Tax=Solimonas sp. K1W22B-7 TaxID=2303331 RepID=UPI0013C422AC|nr:hypothetical protein [Solimonas sp. K1W22B-7]
MTTKPLSPMSPESTTAVVEVEKPRLPLPTLDDYFISSVKFCVNQAWKQDAKEEGKFSSKAFVRRGKTDGDRLVVLRVLLDPQKEQWNGPYVFEAEGMANLSHCAAPGFSAEQVDKHAVMIAAPILFGAIRDMAALISAQLPGPKMILPLVPPLFLAKDFELAEEEKSG